VLTQLRFWGGLAGSGGAEHKGLYRVHQFSKVEMFVLCHPDKSEAMHKELLDIELDILTSLGLHFQYDFRKRVKDLYWKSLMRLMRFLMLV
jgi:threonyl-tRNA synthetase